MAIVYKVYERENKLPTAKNKTMAVAVPKQLGVIKLKELAEDIADRCTVHRADVLAVLDVLSVSTTSFLNKGFGVELGGLGHFGIRLKSKSAASREEFKPELIKGAMIRYTPSVEMKSKMAQSSFTNYESYFGRKQKSEDDAALPDDGAGEHGDGGTEEGDTGI